ncbi:ERF family protein [Bacillus pacificus]
MVGVKRIAKNGWNDFHKYEFATESDVKEGIQELLSDNGLTLDIELIEDRTQQMPNGWLSTVTMEFTLQDNDTGYMDIKKAKDKQQTREIKGYTKPMPDALNIT